MIRMSLSQLQDAQYAMLVAFSEFCEKHSLKYFLFGGTLLGAVRHNDFIPWDDDLDVSMPRPDYERFIQLTRKSPWDYYTVEQFVQPFIKLVDNRTVMLERLLKKSLQKQNVFIDIFPIDGLPDSISEQHRHFKRIAIWKKCLVLCIVDIRKLEKIKGLKRLSTWVGAFILSLFGYQFFQKLLAKQACRYDFYESKNVSVSIWGWAEKDISKKSELENSVKILFRDSLFSCQGDFDKSLRQKYNDYMKIPDVIDRPPSHGEYYWKRGVKIQ